MARQTIAIVGEKSGERRAESRERVLTVVGALDAPLRDDSLPRDLGMLGRRGRRRRLGRLDLEMLGRPEDPFQRRSVGHDGTRRSRCRSLPAGNPAQINLARGMLVATTPKWTARSASAVRILVGASSQARSPRSIDPGDAPRVRLVGACHRRCTAGVGAVQPGAPTGGMTDGRCVARRSGRSIIA